MNRLVALCIVVFLSACSSSSTVPPLQGHQNANGTTSLLKKSIYDKLPIGTLIFSEDQLHIANANQSIYFSSKSMLSSDHGSIRVNTKKGHFDFPTSTAITNSLGVRSYFVAPLEPLPSVFLGHDAYRIEPGLQGRAVVFVPHVNAKTRDMYPVMGGGGCGACGSNSGTPPSGFTDTQLAGEMDGLSVDNSSVSFNFSSPFDSCDYSYTAEFYGENGAPIAMQNGVGSLVGSYGGVWFDTSGWTGTPYWSVQVNITLNGPNSSAASGNGTAQGY